MEVILQTNMFGENKTLDELEHADKMAEEKSKVVNYKPIQCGFCCEEIRYGDELFLNGEIGGKKVYCSEWCRENDCNFYSIEPEDDDYNDYFEREE